MQKIGAQYIVKRISDYVTAPPAQPAEPSAPDRDLDGQVIHDEQGQRLGTAHRLPDVAVYVVSDGPADHEAELKRCAGEPASRLFFHTEGERLTGLIYVPDPSRLPRRVEGARADEV